jgi:predicted regulator of Ras-like GTPase activity (Roadblock/LC7/MglB family)
MSADEDLILSIAKLVDAELEKNAAIKGISIGTEIATSIYAKFKPNVTNFDEQELIASATSFQYISKSLFSHITKHTMHSTYVTVDESIVIMDFKKEVSAAMVLDRKFAEMDGVEKFQKTLGNLLLQISAIIETSDYLREDPLVKIMRAIPSANLIAFVSKEGLPIKVINLDGVVEPLVGSHVSAISNLTVVMLKQQMDYCFIQGEGACILVVQFDSERILALSLPEEEKQNIGQHLARIKEIIKGYEDSGFNF